MLFKNLYRMIKRSAARFVAIFAIITLGVGFFSGLSVTRKAMIKTGGEYIEDLSLYDFRLVSTLGVTKENADEISRSFGVIARPSVSCDFITSGSGGDAIVIHAHMMTDGVNLPDITEGRGIEDPGECILDNKLSEEFSIGDTVKVAESDPDEAKGKLSFAEYTVVGFANSPVYLSFERGGTSLGDGTAMGFALFDEGAFSFDVYSEIYIKADIPGEIYSDEYKEGAELLHDEIEQLALSLSGERYSSLRADAESEIRDAEEELEKKKSDLQNGEKELDDAFSAYEKERGDALSAFDEKQAQIDLAKSTLSAKADEIAAAGRSPEALLPQVQASLEKAKAELNWQMDILESSQRELDAARAEAFEKLDGALSELEGKKDEINEAKDKIKDAESEIKEAFEKLDGIKPATVYLLGRESNIGYASFESDTSIVSGVAKVFPLFFFIVAAFVCVTTMTRMVSEGRCENGTLKALGFGEWAVSAQYIIYAGVASAAGCTVGFLLGSRLLPLALWKVYNILYTIERPIAYVLDGKLFAVTSVLYLLCALGSTYFVCRRDLSECAASLIRPKAPAAGKRVFLEHIPFLWKRIKFLHKVSIRNILRYKKRMIMMIIGIGGCTALLLTGFGIRDSVRPIVDFQFGEIDLYDANVSFYENLGAEDKKEFLAQTEDISSDVIFLRREVASAVSGGVSKDINVVVFDRESDAFVDLHSAKNKIAPPEKGECVINKRFAEEGGISSGESIMISGDTLGEVSLTVSGVFDNYIYDYAYISPDTFGGRVENGLCNTAYVILKDGVDAHAAGAAMLSCNNVASVTLSEDLIVRVGNMLSSLDYIVLIVLASAGALAFIVLYNLTNIMITEREREIATLKVLGFYLKEQNAYVFRENFSLTVISSLFGIPMGLALLRYVMSMIKISTMCFPCRLEPLSYVLSLLFTIVFALIADAALIGKTKNIDVAKAMKAAE